MLMMKAYAKINIGLNVVGVDQEDSYHLLDMVVLPLELHDRIEIELLPVGYDTLITSDDKELPTDEKNIVYKAERALREKYNYQQKFRIHIHKVIPVGAGLGGGSADGAAVLLGLNKLLNLKLSTDELCEIGLKIGSDIPFCIKNMAARVQGKGNILKPIKQKKGYGVLIYVPKKGLSTKEVYANFDKVGSNSNCDIEALIDALAKDDLHLIHNTMNNELEKSAFDLFEGLENVKQIMANEGLVPTLMTGSGSAFFYISNNQKLLKKAHASLLTKGHNVILTKTL